MVPTCLLFVPGDRHDRFEKALAGGAGAVIFDLEDAVAPERKALAREHVVEHLAHAAGGGTRRLVRINGLRSRAGLEDLLAVAAARPDGIVVPKVESSGEVEIVAGALPGADVVAMVESVAGMERVEEIARASGLTALAFGCADLSAELGASLTWEPLAAYRARLVLAARAAGVAAIDAPFLSGDVRDGVAAGEEAARAVAAGFDGKLAIHPAQVEPIRTAFTPSPAELERARRIVAAAGNGGVAVVDGRMIDAPVVASARRVIARAG